MAPKRRGQPASSASPATASTASSTTTMTTTTAATTTTIATRSGQLDLNAAAPATCATSAAIGGCVGGMAAELGIDLGDLAASLTHLPPVVAVDTASAAAAAAVHAGSADATTAAAVGPDAAFADLFSPQVTSSLESRVAAARARFLTPSPADELALADALRTRIDKGRGETIYELGGLDDDGTSLGFTEAELTTALATIERVAAKHLGAHATYLSDKTNHTTVQTLEAALATRAAAAAGASATATASTADPKNRAGYVLVRRMPTKLDDLMEVRVAVGGNVDSGKSSLLGVLTKNALDNGRGKARVALLKHAHELSTGRTSSVGLECMGFDATGRQVGVSFNAATEVVGATVKPPVFGGSADDVAGEASASAAATRADLPRTAAWDEIAQKSAKMLSLIDLAGHERYLKSAMYGMCGAAPDFGILMVGSNMGVIGMTKEHLGLSLALNLPVMVVVSKVDMCPANVLEATLKQLLKILKSPGCRKIPMFVRTPEDVVRVSCSFVSDRICPIFLVSNVTGEGLPQLRQFLNLLPMMSTYDTSLPVEYQITENFSVPGVGTVVSGTLLSGMVHVGDTLLLGPDSLGHFTPTQVKGIHMKRVPVPVAHAGHSVSFALKRVKRAQLRKGMVLVSRDADPVACREFEAECLVLFHSTTINQRYQAMLHCGNVRQTVSLVDMDRNVLRSGDRALVRFKFMQRPEYIRVGTRVLFREGRTKGIGKITQVYKPGQVIPWYNTTGGASPQATSTTAAAGAGAASAPLPSPLPAAGATDPDDESLLGPKELRKLKAAQLHNHGKAGGSGVTEQQHHAAPGGAGGTAGRRRSSAGLATAAAAAAAAAVAPRQTSAAPVAKGKGRGGAGAGAPASAPPTTTGGGDGGGGKVKGGSAAASAKPRGLKA
ncbi:hypothetical protein H9P43_003353 [Blastocladiella emersonii ATCC 22665]|nr:hypothetical protein H9P43_003353 [Blastocladiella emersonii ATCC 22665]